MERVKEKIEKVEEVKTVLQALSVEPEEVNSYLESVQSSTLDVRQKAAQLILRPNISLQQMQQQLSTVQNALATFDTEVLEQVEIQLKYNSYIEKEKELALKMGQLEDLLIPESFNYEKLNSLSNEAKQKFTKIKPRTLGQASRISGVNPSDVQILMVYMGR